VGEDLVDHRRLGDAGDDAHRAVAGRTRERVDREALLEQGRRRALPTPRVLAGVGDRSAGTRAVGTRAVGGVAGGVVATVGLAGAPLPAAPRARVPSSGRQPESGRRWRMAGAVDKVGRGRRE
jgi:hypothetical protein